MRSRLGGSGESGVLIPPADVTNIKTNSGNGIVYFNWTDPQDITAEGVVVNEWAGSVLIVNKDHKPVDQNDGTALYTSNIRNQHQTEPYIAEGLDAGHKYFFAVFPFSKYGAYNTDQSQTGEFKVMVIPPVKPLAEYTWEEIDLIIQEGDANPEKTEWQVDGITYFSLMDELAPQDFGTTYGSIPFKIIGFLHDEIPEANGGGFAPISFMNAKLIDKAMNPYSSNTYCIEYEFSNTRKFLQNTLYKVAPEQLKSRIQPVLKTVKYPTLYNGEGKTKNVTDKLFMLSDTELSVTINNATEGKPYPAFTDNVSRQLTLLNGTPKNWWLRSPNGNYNHGQYGVISSAGWKASVDNLAADTYVSFGFCIGKGRK